MLYFFFMFVHNSIVIIKAYDFLSSLILITSSPSQPNANDMPKGIYQWSHLLTVCRSPPKRTNLQPTTPMTSILLYSK
jgi:hypothetical protein